MLFNRGRNQLFECNKTYEQILLVFNHKYDIVLMIIIVWSVDKTLKGFLPILANNKLYFYPLCIF